jgi:lipopolysaccharide transport system ATP-binding protein
MTQQRHDEVVIRVDNLGKCYRIYANPKDRLKQAVWRGRRQYYREFWALRGVNLEVRRGETLGIIGRNGSGKSTLLQMICGTLTPSEGSVKTTGRIAALLELGSGFNPEFTGVENVFLNASLLGLSEAQTNERLNDILAFADIGEFAQQPVKTYSSGMVVRLAFSVITQVDPDILVVDEALSVGDAFFTQKCMRFIHRFREHGCLLFVSHDTSAVTSICDRAILIGKGKAQRIGSAKIVTQEYIKDLYASVDENAITGTETPQKQFTTNAVENRKEDWLDYRRERINKSNLANYLEITQFEEALLVSESFGNGGATIKRVSLREATTNRPLQVGLGGENVILEIEAQAHRDLESPIIGFVLKNDKGLVLLGDNTLNSFEKIDTGPITANQRYRAEFEFTLPFLPPGSYSITAALAEGSLAAHSQLHWLNDALILQSDCNCTAAGLAGVSMHRISFIQFQ